MRSFKSLIAKLVFSVLAFSLIAGLFASEDYSTNCSEFGHIHHFNLDRSADDSISSNNPQSASEFECHAGQIFSGIAIFLIAKVDFGFEQLGFENEYQSFQEVFYNSPWPDLPKYPPKWI